MKYKTVIFDLDGTLLDTLGDLHCSTNHALRELGYPQRSMEEVRRFVGNGAGELMRRAVPDGVDHAPALEAFRAHYSRHANDRTAPYPGIVELLETLAQSGVQLAIVSNKPDAQVHTLCQTYFARWIRHACGDREGIRRKPAPDSVHQVMKDMHADPHTTLYVGDSEVDVQTAQNAGIDCCAVLWGFRDRAVLEAAGATRFASAAQEILNQ